ncbi:NAD(P)-dependent oxidoreductase, partial [Chloroflexota bacterium]
QVTRARYADIVFPGGQLLDMLAESDFVVLAVPYTPETDKLIGEKELRAMKSSAYLVNIGRGRTVDEEALVRALDEHWIAGAGLDAFATEPLPTDSKLWELPNVIYSPHVSGDGEDVGMIATELFCENLRRYMSGKRLLNIINKKRGY